MEEIQSKLSLIGQYTVGIVDWTIAELEDLDRKTMKLMTAHRALHPQSDIDRLYLPRKNMRKRTPADQTDSRGGNKEPY